MDVPNRRVRGAHAHRKCRQFLLCPRGSVAVVLDDGKHRQEVILAEPNLGLDLMPGVWAVQYKYTSDALLFVAASDPYDSDDYIRDYAGFIRWKNISPAGHMQLDGDNRVKGG
jgi:dTDP-4-dehydrorhamnose 3,5-epimerase-like enzyme